MGTISPGIPLSGTLQFSNPLFELLIANLGGHVVFGISLINLEGRSKGHQNNISTNLSNKQRMREKKIVKELKTKISLH